MSNAVKTWKASGKPSHTDQIGLVNIHHLVPEPLVEKQVRLIPRIENEQQG